LHVVADAANLVEAEAMYLVRRHLRRRVTAGVQLVPFTAVGQLGQADALAARGQIGLRKVAIELAIRRQDCLFDRLPSQGPQALLLSVGK
jgi:hypothetical protein